MIILEAKNIYKTYPMGRNNVPGVEVLKGIDLAITKGEIIAIVGASGAGKSTLLHILGALDQPTQGVVYYDGVDIFQMRDEELAKFRNKEIGFIFQFHHLLPEFTALENVAMPALILGKKFKQVSREALQLLKEVGLEDRAHHKPNELSGGEQQRVAVARALMNKPKIVLADEPSGNLDSTNSALLHDLLWNLSKKWGQTFVIVTHNEELAKKADRIVKIVDGKIREDS